MQFDPGTTSQISEILIMKLVSVLSALAALAHIVNKIILMQPKRSVTIRAS